MEIFKDRDREDRDLFSHKADKMFVLKIVFTAVVFAASIIAFILSVTLKIKIASL